jgi:hypothetical protein
MMFYGIWKHDTPLIIGIHWKYGNYMELYGTIWNYAVGIIVIAFGTILS